MPTNICASNGPGTVIRNFAGCNLETAGGLIFGADRRSLLWLCWCAVHLSCFGHRGFNHPVRELSTGRIDTTSQNHGYVVDPESVSAPS